ncbi:MAG: efflux RND transporter permease subunit [Spirochaetes bacterium]|nr:efflux RND transporter permease subunit [Spirochaetota bacterium]MBN2772015.1 efflux RND transporter permease subunit [Spirochaetota bacterium]
MRRIINYFITHKRITNMVIMMAFLSGIFSLTMVKKEMFPDVSFDAVQIRTVYPGASPEDVEIFVTDAIEEKLLEVENIKRLSSTSFENYSVITIQIDSDAGDPDKTKDNIREALSRVNNLPSAVTERPQYIEIKSSNLPLFEIALTGDDEPLLRRYSKSLETGLKEINGVARVDIKGYRKREVLIEADMELLTDNQLPFGQLTEAIKARNIRNTGGTLESYVSDKKIVTLAEFRDPFDVNDVIVRSNTSGFHLAVKDVARVSDTFEEPVTLYRANGRRAIGLTVVANSEADVVSLGRKAKKLLADFNEKLPQGVNARLVGDNSILTSIMISMMISNGLMGFALVLLILFVFLDLRSAFWCAFSIPLSIITAFALFSVFGLTINLVTLVTLILLLGILVDDAIVITEKIHVIKSAGKAGREHLIDGVIAMSFPVAASVLTTILAFLPLKFVPGVMGRFMSDIPLVVILLLVISFIDAVFFIPSHVSHKKIVKSKVDTGDSAFSKLIAKYTAIYERLIEKCVTNKKKVLSCFILCLAALLTFAIVKIDFMLDEDIDPDLFQIIVEAPDGTSLEETEEMVKVIEQMVIETVPAEVLQGLASEVGHHDTDYFGVSLGLHSEWALLTINLITSSKRKITCEELIEKIIPKAQLLKDKLNLVKMETGIPAALPVGKAFDIAVVSDDDNERIVYEKQIVDFLHTIEGVKNIQTTSLVGKDELVVLPDYKELARVGLTSADVAMAIRSAFEGEVVTTSRIDGEKVNYRVKLLDSKKFREDMLLRIPVANAEGRMVRLEHVVTLAEQKADVMIIRENGKRSVNITADVDTDIITSSRLNKIITNFLADKPSPQTHFVFGGQAAESAESLSGFLFAGIFVFVSIYFILVILFDSYMLPTLIMSIIPFAVCASFLTLVVHGRPLIMISMLGMLGLIGVVVNDTIVMITHLAANCVAKKYTIKMCAKAASTRLRPVVLTTLTTFAGLLPAAYGVGGDIPSVRPMVLVMAWGLLFCTIVTLVFIPVLYSIVRPPAKR